MFFVLKGDPIFMVDRNDRIASLEIFPENASEPNYGQALEPVRRAGKQDLI
jgi:hypothetical protein